MTVFMLAFFRACRTKLANTRMFKTVLNVKNISNVAPGNISTFDLAWLEVECKMKRNRLTCDLCVEDTRNSATAKVGIKRPKLE